MNKTIKQATPQNAITVNIDGAVELLGCGKATARKIGEESGAVIKLGHRNLYKVDVLKEYMSKL